jgi:hypothetical protein
MDDPRDQPTKKEHCHGGAVCWVQRHGYCESAHPTHGTWEPMWKGLTKGSVAGFYFIVPTSQEKN